MGESQISERRTAAAHYPKMGKKIRGASVAKYKSASVEECVWVQRNNPRDLVFELLLLKANSRGVDESFYPLNECWIEPLSVE